MSRVVGAIGALRGWTWKSTRNDWRLAMNLAITSRQRASRFSLRSVCRGRGKDETKGFDAAVENKTKRNNASLRQMETENDKPPIPVVGCASKVDVVCRDSSSYRTSVKLPSNVALHRNHRVTVGVSRHIASLMGREQGDLEKSGRLGSAAMFSLGLDIFGGRPRCGVCRIVVSGYVCLPSLKERRGIQHNISGTVEDNFHE